jgi:hypothetical protein
MGDLQVAGQLLRGEAGGGVEELGGGPEAVVEMGKEGGFRFHNAKAGIETGSTPAIVGLRENGYRAASRARR